MSARNSTWGLLLGALIGAAVTACPGSLDDPEAFRFQIAELATGGTSSGGGGAGGAGAEDPEPPLCPIDVPEAIFKPTCATALCHDAEGAEVSGGLRLDGDDIVDQLIGATVGTEACRDAGYALRVDPDDPEGSGLLIHLLEQPTPDCSQQMPSGAEPLDAHDIECVRLWIEHAIWQRSRDE